MIDELFEQIHLGGKPSARGARVARAVFGLLGCGLGVAGVIHLLGPASPVHGIPLRLAAATLMAAVAAFFLFNVLLARTWRWPGLLLLCSLPLLFLVRIVLGP